MLTVEIEGKEVQVELDKVKLPEGHHLITPDSVPDGYYSQSALEKKIQDRLKNEKQTTTEQLKQDGKFRAEILESYGISLDDEDKPKGLVAEKDLETIKTNAVNRVKAEWEEKLTAEQKKAQSLARGVIKAEILGWAAKNLDEKALFSFGNGDPYIVSLVADQFGLDENLKPALKDNEGFAISGNGSRISVPEHLETLAKTNDEFKKLLRDTRQNGSGFKKPGNGNPSLTKDALKDPKARAMQFDVWRTQGLKPLEELEKLPDK